MLHLYKLNWKSLFYSKMNVKKYPQMKYKHRNNSHMQSVITLSSVEKWRILLFSKETIYYSAIKEERRGWTKMVQMFSLSNFFLPTFDIFGFFYINIFHLLSSFFNEKLKWIRYLFWIRSSNIILLMNHFFFTKKMEKVTSSFLL